MSPQLTEVAEHVHAYVQPDGGWCVNNAGVVVSDGEALLIDTAATETRAHALREAVKGVNPAAPRMLVNTHSHGDHTFGNFVFPEAVVIGHRRTRDEVLQIGLHLTTLWPDVCWGDVELTPPQVTFDDRLTLHVGSVRAELMHLGPAHTTNDTVVWMPDQRVLFTGDLVMSGATPFCPMGSVSGSIEAVRALRKLGPEVVVAGHGPVAGPELLDSTEGYFLMLQRLAKDGVAAGLTPVEVARETDLGEYAGLLDAERIVPNLHRAYIEEKGGAPGSPVDMPAVFAEMVEFNGGLPACHA
ncbi:MBL fold metallo-hydrolase [Streptomyces griseocarneus]|uniref:MBL fold metallo-hydrolase n=1 Tax=Streptomyces griseocarneus TaxID=51201 RepID=UPI00167CE83C|nr:MBL fold metallo-hydrolase [Streptomyces griseocarneus]MBZ6478145.1 MBL fold metallo-hydrolase [Streptomyces griseocarneus]GHG84110.1 MBL fold metallo-hydrolase [Streptomyces griseocarneus]